MRYELLYPNVECQYCRDGRPCDACRGTGVITHGLDNSAYGFSVEYPAVRDWSTVHVGEAEGTDLEIAEQVFELFNIGNRPVSVRSMSVGDRIRVGDRLYVCKPVGFEEVA